MTVSISTLSRMNLAKKSSVALMAQGIHARDKITDPQIRTLFNEALQRTGRDLQRSPLKQSQFSKIFLQHAQQLTDNLDPKDKQLGHDFLLKASKSAKDISQYSTTLLGTISRNPFQTVPPQRFTLYDTSSTRLPQIVLDFSKSAPHTIPLDDYLDVRMSQMIQGFVKEGTPFEVFIGPVGDIDPCYKKHNQFKRIANLETKSSVKYFLLEDDNGNRKVVVAGITNESKLTHMLLQLRAAGVQEKNLSIRGNMQESLKYLTTQLTDKFESAINHQPVALAVMGTRWGVVLDLAKRLYPEELKKAPEGKEGDLAEELLKTRNNY